MELHRRLGRANEVVALAQKTRRGLGVTLACQMSRASSYFLARSEGWRRLWRRNTSFRSKARWIATGALA
jgi:hypothetical protein